MYPQRMSVAEEYQRRTKQREAVVARHETVHVRLGNLRLLMAVGAAAIAWASLKQHALSPWWIFAPVVGFAALAAYHSRVLRARELAQRAVAFYRTGLARIEDRWAGNGQTGERFNDPHHVYAADLDLFGKGSLFELLSTARTRKGEETLARWLLAPSAVQQIRERHGAVRELRDELDFREDLAVLGTDANVGVYPEALLRWAESPSQLTAGWIRWFSLLLAILAVVSAVVWGVFGTITPLIVIILIEAGVRHRLRDPMKQILHGSEHAFRDLGLLAGVLARFERQKFASERLQSLQRNLVTDGISSSKAIQRLRRIVELVDSRENWFVRLLDVPLMYSVQLAFVAERWRRVHGRAVRSWLDAVGEIEALLCLATYSYEHPQDPFPEFVEDAACLEGAGIGHPLIPEAKCVRNDVSLCHGVRTLLVSGSNMSGKSTLMRAVGMNTVLAMAGAPVRAERLRITPLQVGASIRVNDSLQEGHSRFYAEITRLRQVLNLAGNPPSLLFLLDELLQGTNSQDRRVGAEGVLMGLLKRGAIGMISTHDLALAEIGGSLDGQLHNVHFQENFAEGRMTFDYRLREGTVTKSNGLELMRSIGLEV